MKKCPFCAEEVQDQAVKCKHCQSDLVTQKSSEPTKAPKEPVNYTWCLIATGYVIVFTAFYVGLAVGAPSDPWIALIIGLFGIWSLPDRKDNKPMREKLRQWRKYWQRSALTAFLIFIAVGMQAMSVAVDIDHANQSEVTQEAPSTYNSSTPRVEIKPSFTISSKIEDVVMGADDVTVFTPTYDEATGKEEVEVTIKLADTTPYSMLHVDAYNVLKTIDAAYLESSIDRVTIIFKQDLIDTYGKEQTIQVMFIRMSRDTWEKVNWETFLIDNIPKIADEYTVHDAIL